MADSIKIGQNTYNFEAGAYLHTITGSYTIENWDPERGVSADVSIRASFYSSNSNNTVSPSEIAAMDGFNGWYSMITVNDPRGHQPVYVANTIFTGSRFYLYYVNPNNPDPDNLIKEQIAASDIDFTNLTTHVATYNKNNT